MNTSQTKPSHTSFLLQRMRDVQVFNRSQTHAPIYSADRKITPFTRDFQTEAMRHPSLKASAFKEQGQLPRTFLGNLNESEIGLNRDYA